MTTPAITSLTDQLKRDEGTVLHTYQDSRGYWTIGSGICIDERVGCGITDAENTFLLANRISRASADVNAHLPWTTGIDGVRRAVLVNMCYQLGIAKLLEFVRMLAHAERREWALAGAEMLNSKWAKQTPERAKRLSRQMIFGEWQ
jgi:lysozyme